MSRRALGAVFACVIVSGSVDALADEGRIPIFEPTTISQPGKYIVTNDFAASGIALIQITATDVNIDLGGHTLTRTGAAGPVIDITSTNTFERRLTVANGHLTGGGISSSYLLAQPEAPKAPDVPSGRVFLRFSHLVITGAGIDVATACWGFDLTDSEIDGAVNMTGNTATIRLRVVDNWIGTLTAGSVSGAVVRGNTIGTLTLAAGDLGSTRNLIESNVVTGTLALTFNGSGNDLVTIRNNVANALTIDATRSLVTGNLVYFGGITVSGDRNIIDGNSVTGALTYGLVLNGSNNVYRNNVLHNNTTGAVQDNGTGNVNAGSNVN